MLSYDEVGTGPPVVLLHGLPMDRSTWCDVIPLLASEARVITCDLRGHGRSPGEGPFDLAIHAADVCALMDAVALPTAVIVGHSFGGYVALEVLRRAPQRVAGLVLVATAIGADTPAVAAARRGLADAIEAGLPANSDEIVAMFFAPQTLRERPMLIAQQRNVMGSVAPTAVADALRSVAERSDAHPLLASSPVPRRIVLGQGDPTLDTATILAGAGGAATVVEGASHMVPFEAPHAVAAAVRSLLA